MTKILVLIFSLYSLTSFAGSSIPCWMVKLEKTLEDGMIRGTGYVVKYDGKFFVRTASHVTLGSTEKLKIIDCKNKPVAYTTSNFISNSMMDDFLIELDDNNLPAIGIHHPGTDLFLVPSTLYSQFVKNRRRVEAEYPISLPNSLIQSDSYISPEWVKKREQFKFSLDRRDPFLMTIGHSAIEQNKGEVREAEFSSLILGNMSVIPGESGSPLIGWSDYLNPNSKVRRFVQSDFNDSTGLKIDVAIDTGRGSVACLKGHALAYHRKFILSKFLSAKAYSELQSSYVNAKGSDINHTRWFLKDGNDYRKYSTENLVVSEIDDGSGKSGDGTGGHGGDGTGGHGGDGTGGHGGDGNSLPDIKQGLIYNDQVIISFKLLNNEKINLGAFTNLKSYFKANAYLVANWYNFVILNTIQSLNEKSIYEIVKKNDSIAEFFNNRFANSGYLGHSSNLSCRIDRKSLIERTLKMEIQLGSLPGDEIIHFESTLKDLKALASFKTHSFGMIEMDLSGLFGIDFSFVGKKFNPEDSLTPSIMLRNKKSVPEIYQCSLI